MMLLLVIVGSLLTVFESVQRTQMFTQERSQTLDDMRVALSRITKEARQASSVAPTSTASKLDLQTYVNGVATQVVYEAAGSTLTRTAGGSAAPILSNLNSTVVFTYAPAVTQTQVVTITLNVHPVRRPDTVVSLTSEVRLRNQGTS